MSYRKIRRSVVEVGEASESDEAEDLNMEETGTTQSTAKSTLSRLATSTEESSNPSFAEAATSVNAEFPARPIYCRSLVEGNVVFSRGIREAAALPYAVAIREIDDLALDLVKGQQLMDDVYRVLETVGTTLQTIEREADELRTSCLRVLPSAHQPGSGRTEKPPAPI